MSESATPSSITQSPPVPTVETPIESVVVPEKKLSTVQKKVETEIVDNFSTQLQTPRQSEKEITIKDHPLYAPWRDMESMQFPEQKKKIRESKNSLNDSKWQKKEEDDHLSLWNSENGSWQKKDKEGAEKKAEKNKEGAEKKAEKDKEGAEKKAEKDKVAAEKKAEKDKVAAEKKVARAKKKAERKAKRKEKRSRFNEKYTLNPVSWVWFWWKETLKTAFSLPANIIAKAAHIVGRPQSLFVWEMRSDLAKNTGRWFVNFFRTIAWTVYKPYRKKLEYENIFKDYWASFNPEWSKWLSALGLWLLRWFWSIPRIPAQLVEWLAHTVGETATWKFDYTHTSDAFKKAFSLIHDKPAASSQATKK